jgi:hypothetical protein
MDHSPLIDARVSLLVQVKNKYRPGRDRESPAYLLQLNELR